MKGTKMLSAGSHLCSKRKHDGHNGRTQSFGGKPGCSRSDQASARHRGRGSTADHPSDWVRGGASSFHVPRPSAGLSPTPFPIACLVGGSLACLLVAAAIYFRYYHKTIDVMYELALRSAYADLTHEDLDLPRAHWIRRRGRWLTGSVLFFAGCALYAAALFLSLFA